jgi:hypothetical protein
MPAFGEVRVTGVIVDRDRQEGAHRPQASTSKPTRATGR